MSYEMTVGLVVVDQDLYGQYRREMRPLLDEAGGAFRFDFEVARVIHHEGVADINRTCSGFRTSRARSGSSRIRATSRSGAGCSNRR